jgi:hypothetical protein
MLDLWWWLLSPLSTVSQVTHSQAGAPFWEGCTQGKGVPLTEPCMHRYQVDAGVLWVRHCPSTGCCPSDPGGLVPDTKIPGC